jgi:hypothetical protein
MAKEKDPKSGRIFYVKLASLNDICRYVENFDYTASNVVSMKEGNAYALMAFGEQLEGCTIAYYVNTTGRERIICYTYPSSNGQEENAHFVEEIGMHPNHYINILEMEAGSIKKAKKVKPIPSAKVHSTDDLIIAAIRRGVSHESLPQIYSFSHKGKTVICAFDIIEELSDGQKTIYYAVCEKKPNASFARYKYSDNKVDFAEYMGEHSYMYAKIINLAEPFPFFKMPE